MKGRFVDMRYKSGGEGARMKMDIYWRETRYIL